MWAWLSRTTGARYRLRIESEWERAVSGSQRGCYLARTDRSGTCPVGSYGSNATGLSDMVGNLWEWTEDCMLCKSAEMAVGGSQRSASAPSATSRSCARARKTPGRELLEVRFELCRVRVVYDQMPETSPGRSSAATACPVGDAVATPTEASKLT